MDPGMIAPVPVKLPWRMWMKFTSTIPQHSMNRVHIDGLMQEWRTSSAMEGAMEYQITSLTIVYSTIYSWAAYKVE